MARRDTLPRHAVVPLLNRGSNICPRFGMAGTLALLDGSFRFLFGLGKLASIVGRYVWCNSIPLRFSKKRIGRSLQQRMGRGGSTDNSVSSRAIVMFDDESKPH
jgi:hypothetical protein